jgi:pyruvate formate lyase activating enzyme
MFQTPEGDRVRCGICPHGCLIPPGRAGICRTRVSRGGKIITLIDAVASSMHLDPIEKKPLYHFFPGSKILSLGTLGCNFACLFCQNWSISQLSEEDMRKLESRPEKDPLTPEAAAEAARSLMSRGNIGIAYTYNEPTIWYEFVTETSRIIKEMGLYNCMVTNGFINEEPLLGLLPFMDAFNIDIKSMREDFYVKYCKGRLEPVLRTCEIASKKALVEITNLVIPTLNDTDEDFERLSGWILDHIGKDTPLHFSRYHPDYKADFPATPQAALEKAHSIASKKLNYVYVGNVHTDKWNNTYCPKCGKAVISRSGFNVTSSALSADGRCAHCCGEVRITGVVRG